MVIDVSNGEKDQEIKILFGGWLTVADLNGTKFIIQPTDFNGIGRVTGSGEFSGNQMIMNYTQTATEQIVNYSGTLSKF
ncbi:MAG: hypothetical protein H7321_04130 [Bacteroidia bacterium]|nr:hypothetical protein [Bacteroidia bacterium]